MADEGRKMVMAYPSSFGFDEKIVPEKFKPTAHIFYSERVMDVSRRTVVERIREERLMFVGRVLRSSTMVLINGAGTRRRPN